MAQEKKKEGTIRGWLQAEVERIDREQPVVETRYCVVEVTPSKRFSDEYENGWTPVSSKRVSEYSDTVEGLDDFLDKFEPDEGNHFEIAHQNKRRIERWVNY